MRLVWWALAVAFVLLGLLWAADRGRRWEGPRLDPAAFEVLRGQHGARGASRGIVLVPLNPSCPRCLTAWRRLLGSCMGTPDCDRLVALLVDQERRPDATTLEMLDAPRLWWDRRGVWRHRWGHRIYGERMRFDAAGRYRGTLPPVAP